jgi:hypothetical protein
MEVFKKVQVLRFGKKLGLVAGLIGFISSVIGIYSFIDSKEQDLQVTKQLQLIADSIDNISQDMKELNSSTMLLAQRIESLESGIDTGTEKDKVALEVQKAGAALESSRALAQKIDQSIKIAKEHAYSIESEISEDQRAILDERLRRLQAQKKELEIQLEMARKFGEEFRKMEDNAIKRFAIDV